MECRQQSLDPAYFSHALEQFGKFEAELEASLAAHAGDIQLQSETLKLHGDRLWQAVMLRYSAGEQLDQLAQSLTQVIEAYERYSITFNTIEREVWDSAFTIHPYQPYAAHLDLCAALILFRREDLLPRFFDLNRVPEYHGIDSPFETLREFYFPHRHYFGTCRWTQYEPLMHALNGPTAAQRSRRMEKYVKGWFSARHEEAAAAGQTVAGAWAMCAAAYVYLFDIDDGIFRDEPVYPKDLVDYARSRPRTALGYIDVPGYGIHIPRDQELNSLAFVQRRRQPFLPEQSYLDTLEWYDREAILLEERLAEPDHTPRSRASLLEGRANTLWNVFELRYTAGEDLDLLAQSLSQVVAAYENAADVGHEAADEDYYPPIILNDLIDVYIEYLNLLSAAVLLHRDDLIPRIFGLIEGTDFDGADAVIEDLLGFYLPGRPSLDTWYWKTHTPLLDALDQETQAGRAKSMAKYVDGWYQSMRGAACFWGKHEKLEPGFSPYNGYWAMCAAAFSYLYEIDDSSYRDNMVYPKAMVDFARSKPRIAKAPATGA
ncbi:PoNe immunity protein domain-containing protein [Pseudoduganella sp.]|uniref:PoNe immunity protein domain-containing protein n=1 Tax=Pseudoduganella sp. TaxID=1880898 RepID=UPI0035AE1D3B